MKIIFAPAKTFNENVTNYGKKIELRKETKELLNILKSWNKEEIKQTFRVSDEIMETVYQYYNQFDLNQSHLAFSLYQGTSYQSLNYDALSMTEKDYLNQNVIVIDAFYGLIKPNDLIKPYRLDFTVKNLDLRSRWKKIINDYLKSVDEPILSLTSSEFSGLINSKIPYFEVSFYDMVKGKMKAVSVYNKQNRGALLQYIAKNQITDVEMLPNEFNGYIKIQNGREITYQRGE